MSFQGFKIMFSSHGMSTVFGTTDGPINGSDIQDCAVLAIAKQATKQQHWEHDGNYCEIGLGGQQTANIIACRRYTSPGSNTKYELQHIISSKGGFEINGKSSIDSDNKEKEEREEKRSDKGEDNSEEESDESEHGDKPEASGAGCNMTTINLSFG